MINVSELIKSLRTEKGLSQLDLAEKIGVKQNTVSAYELGRKRPSYEVLVAIADLFGVTTDYLLGREV